MSAVRWALGSIGVLMAGYGGWLLLTRQAGDQLVSATQWLAGGVALPPRALALKLPPASPVAGDDAQVRL